MPANITNTVGRNIFRQGSDKLNEASAKNIGYSVTDYDKVTWQVVEKEGMKLFHHSWQTYMSVDQGAAKSRRHPCPRDAMTFVFHGAPYDK